MRNYDNEFIKMAEQISKKSTMHYHLGTLIVSKKYIISFGFNRFSGLNSYHIFGNKWSIHAEADALRKALPYIHDNPTAKLTAYVARTGKKNARPCSNCMKLLSPYIDRFVYTIGGEIVEEFNRED